MMFMLKTMTMESPGELLHTELRVYIESVSPITH